MGHWLWPTQLRGENKRDGYAQDECES